MKRKILFSSLFLLSIFTMTACNNNNFHNLIEKEYIYEFKNTPDKGNNVEEIKFNGINYNTKNVEEIKITNNQSYEDVFSIFQNYGITVFKPVSKSFKENLLYKETEDNELAMVGGYDKENIYSVATNYKKNEGYMFKTTFYVNNSNEKFYDIDGKNLYDLNLTLKTGEVIDKHNSSNFDEEVYTLIEDRNMEYAAKNLVDDNYVIDYYKGELNRIKFNNLPKNRSLPFIGSVGYTDARLKNYKNNIYTNFSFELTDKFIIFKFNNDKYFRDMSDQDASNSEILKQFEGSHYNEEIWFDYTIVNIEENDYKNLGYTYYKFESVYNENVVKTYTTNPDNYYKDIIIRSDNLLNDLEGKTTKYSNKYSILCEAYMLNMTEEEFETKKIDLLNYCKQNKNV